MCTIVAPVFAVDAEGDSGQHRRIGTERTLSMRGVDGMHPGAAAIRRHARPVKGAPYSAEVVSERQQNLADGNQIVNKTSSFSYRDSAGRTRQEMHNAKGEVLTVAISDPVAGVVLMLDTRTKTGTRISTGLASNLAANHAADLAANLPAEERKATLEAARAGRTAAQRGQAGARRTRGHHHSPCRRRRADRIAEPAPRAARRRDGRHDMGGQSHQQRARHARHRRDQGGGRTAQLRHSSRQSRSCDAITVSDESWYSPELRVTLMLKHSDPRAGDNVYRLTAVKRDEPAASLFAAPLDYTIRDRSHAAPPMEKKTP